MTTIECKFFDKSSIFKGEIIQAPKWAGKDYVAMTTTNPEFPMRLIAKKVIHLVDGKPFQGEIQQNSTAPTFFVLGDKNKRYQVRKIAGKMVCHCTGYAFRHTCRHAEIAEMQESLGLGRVI